MIALFAVPAVIVPGALDRFVFGKLLLAAIGVALAFSIRPTGRLPQAPRILLAAAAAVLTVSAVVSHSPGTAFFGRAPRSEGILVLALYLLAGVSGARLFGPDRDERRVRIALATMASCALAVAFLAVLESFGLRPLSSDLDRPGSLLGNASDQGAFAVLYGGPLLAAAVRSRRALPSVGAAAALLTVVLSGSRGALLGVLVLLVLVFVVGSQPARRITVAGLAGVAALSMAVPFTRDRILGQTPLSGQTLTGRNLLWRETLSLFGQHPVLGVGPSQFEVAIVGEHDLRWQRSIGPANPPASPHNWILQTAMAGGLLLLIVALLLVGLLVRDTVRLIRDGDHAWAAGLLAGLSGYGVALLFHLTAPSTTIPAAVFAGALLARAPSTAEAKDTDRWVRRGSVTLAAALAVCFAAAALAEVWLRLGDDAVAKGRLADANSDFNVARVLRPWDADLDAAAFHQFVASTTAGNAAAVPYAGKWGRHLAGVADDEQVVQNRAALLQAQGKFADAVALLDRQLTIDPDNPMVLLLRGVVRARQGDYGGAERDLMHSARVDRGNPKPWQDLAMIYKAEGKTALAARAAAKAAQLD